jgi:hypothetical protein
MLVGEGISRENRLSIFSRNPTLYEALISPTARTRPSPTIKGNRCRRLLPRRKKVFDFDPAQVVAG